MSKIFVPQEVQSMIGILPDVLRDQRRRGILKIGTNQNGRWAYRPGDVIALAIVQFLTGNRLVTDLSDAFAVAESVTQHVWAWMTSEVSELVDGYRNIKYVAIWPTNGELQVKLFGNPESIIQWKLAGYIFLDLQIIADELKDRLAPVLEEVAK